MSEENTETKPLIPETHCIEVQMWTDREHKNLHQWKERVCGMSTMSTGAGTIERLVEILTQGLANGHTHFVASYPVAMQGRSTEGNPHGPMFTASDRQDAVTSMLVAMPSNERAEVLGKFCRHCGDIGSNCTCMKDE